MNKEVKKKAYKFSRKICHFDSANLTFMKVEVLWFSCTVLYFDYFYERDKSLNQPYQRMPGFANLKMQGSCAQVWIGKSLLPFIQSGLSTCPNPEVVDLGLACIQIFRNETNLINQPHYKIEFKLKEDRDGAEVSLHSTLIPFVAESFIKYGDVNKAVAKLGFELSELNRFQHNNRTIQKTSQVSFHQGVCVAGINTQGDFTTLLIQRSTCEFLSSQITDGHPLKKIFADLANLLDPFNEEVDDELEQLTDPMHEVLVSLQK